MATRKKASPKKDTPLAQGKERRLGSSGRPWRVRLYGPPPGTKGYTVQFKAPNAEDQWVRVLRRATDETEARKLFDQAEAALDTEQALPVSATERATRTIADEHQGRRYGCTTQR